MLVFDVLFCIFVVVFCVQILFYLFVFGHFSFRKIETGEATLHPISVLICAKNEAENLKKHLPFVLDQDYPKFEVVLINDGSTDDTLQVMEAFKSAHSNVKVVNVKSIEAFWGNKKYALTLGIKAATYNQLLFTDADCKPLSNQWIKRMGSCFTTGKSIVIGYGAYKKQPKSFLNKLVRFETLLTAIQYFSYAKMGQPYMAVGRNLAYTKAVFFESRGFMNHMDIKSGDDDLFVNETASPSNTSVCYSIDSFTESIPKATYADWLLQKRRHISTAKHYKPKHKAYLAIFYISQVLFLILGISLMFSTQYWKIAIGLIGLRYLMVFIIVSMASKKLNEKDLLPYVPLLELFLISSQFSIFIKNLTSRPNHWK